MKSGHTHPGGGACGDCLREGEIKGLLRAGREAAAEYKRRKRGGRYPMDMGGLLLALHRWCLSEVKRLKGKR